MTEIVVGTPMEIVDRLRKLADEYPGEMARAIFQELSVVMTKSKTMCPVDTGALRGSGHVEEPIIEGGLVSARIGYSANYAWYVHELIDNYHAPPTQAKFLEVPLVDALPDMLTRIIERTEMIVAGA
jgi:hypothetical protein